MPAHLRHQHYGTVALRFCKALGLFLHRRLNGAPLLVQPIQFGRDSARFFTILCRQQADAQIGFAHAPSGIYARAEREAKVMAAWRTGEAARLCQGVETDIAALRHHFQALRDERAVEAAELRNIGHGSKGDKVKQVHQAGLCFAIKIIPIAQLPDQRGGEQKSDTDGSEMAL